MSPSIKYSILIFLLIMTSCTTELDVTECDAQVIKIEQQDLAPKPEIETLIRSYRDSMEKIMDKVLCESEAHFPKIKGQAETALGNLVADLCLHEARHMSDIQIDACLMNIGGLRTSLPEGEITLGNVFELMPFDNELVVVTLPPHEIDSMFHYLAVKGGDPVSGIRMSILDGMATNKMIGDQDVKPGKSYAILTSDYLSNGGDHMNFLTKGRREGIEFLGLKVRDAIAQHFEAKGAEGISLRVKLDNRIRHE